MKNKITVLLVSIVLLLPLSVFAANRHHRPNPSPSPAPTPPPASSSIPWGAFTGNTKPLGSYQAVFVGDGDSFTSDAKGFTLPLVVYWESDMTAQQIATGKADSFLKQWATQMAQYKQPIVFVVLDEMNGNWSSYYGNPTEYKLAFQRTRNFFTAQNVKFAYDPNASFPGNPVSSFTAYYPGDNYVDLVGLDGFDFGGQTFSQVFAPSISAMEADFPSKPLWILSTGSVDNQAAFIQAAFNSGVKGIIFFSYQQFTLTSAAQSTLQTL